MKSAMERLVTGYEPRWDIDAAVGQLGEGYAANVIEDLKTSSVEIKTDEKALKTHNIYVETECLRNGEYVSSGISTSQARFWAYVLGRSLVLVLPTHILRQAMTAGTRSACTRGSHPTKGYLVSLSALIAASFTHIEQQGSQF